MWDVTALGLALIFVGFAAVLVALLTSAGSTGERVKGAGVVMVGPIPLVLGSDARWASVAIALAIVLVLLSILFYVL